MNAYDRSTFIRVMPPVTQTTARWSKSKQQTANAGRREWSMSKWNGKAAIVTWASKGIAHHSHSACLCS